MAYSNWDTTPANNSDAPPNGFPEGMAASALNNGIRQLMADMATMRDAIKNGAFFTGDLDLTGANSLTLLDDSVTTSKVLDANITGPKVADNAITLAKQAHGTQGGVPYYGASGAPSELAAGTAGEVYTTGGAGADPSWAVAPVPAGYADGCTLSLNSTDSDHDLDITAGLHRDSTNTINITSAADTVQCDVVFGTGNGILASGSLANSTNYYLFTITKAAGADQKYFLYTSADPTGNLPTDYVYFAILNGGLPLLTNGSANLINSMNGKFTSEDVTVTSSGTGTLAHGLGTADLNVWYWLVIQNATLGYEIGEVVPVTGTMQSTASFNGGVGVGHDATDFNYTYSSASDVFIGISRTTKGVLGFGNSDVKFRITAEVR